MHSERDYLIKEVFPELRERCLRKGLQLIDVDLRWGVTEKEAEQGKVLEICLDEIENCRPFFIGLLGDRYGYVPEEYIVPDHPKYDWLTTFEKGHSYTALEIFHGILNNPEMRPRAFFYFRNPSFIDEVPETKKSEITEAEGSAVQKLISLKNKIRKIYSQFNLTGHVVNYNCTYHGLRINWQEVKHAQKDKLSKDDLNLIEEIAGDDYLADAAEYNSLNENQRKIIDEYSVVYLNELESFGEHVLNDLWNAISEEFPDKETLTDPFENEREYHNEFIANFTEFFWGRDKEIALVLDYIEQKSHFPLGIIGKPGVGKSALMARIIELFQNKRTDFQIISHFVGASPDSTRIELTLIRLISEIYIASGRSLPNVFPENANELYQLFKTAIKQLSNIKKKFLIIIDSIDQFGNGNKISHFLWLVQEIPSNCKFIFTSTPSPIIVSLKNYGIKIFNISPLGKKQSKEIVCGILREYRKTLEKEDLDVLCNKKESILPIYLKIAGEELRLYPKREDISQRILNLSQSVQGLLVQFFNRIEFESDKKLVTNILSLIGTSRNGLTENELLEILGTDQITPISWAKTLKKLRPYIVNFGPADFISFFNSQMLDAVRKCYLRSNRNKKLYYRKLADYGLVRFGKFDQNILKTIFNSPSSYWDTAIYLLLDGQTEKIIFLIKSIFSGAKFPEDLNIKIVDSLFYFSIYEANISQQQLFKKIIRTICSASANDNLSDYLLYKGQWCLDHGNARMALFMVKSSQSISRRIEKYDLDSYDILGATYRILGNTRKALEAFNESFQWKMLLLGEDPDEITMEGLSITLINLGDLHTRLGEISKAINSFKRASVILTKQCKKNPGNNIIVSNLARSLRKSGQIYSDKGDYAKAFLLIKESEKPCLRYLKNNPNDIVVKYSLFWCYYRLSNISSILNEAGKTVFYAKKSNKIIEEIYCSDPSAINYSLDYFMTLSWQATISKNTGDINSALKYLKQAHSLIKNLFRKNKDNLQVVMNYVESLNNMADNYFRLGSTNLSLNLYHESIKIARKWQKIDPGNELTANLYAKSNAGLGFIYLATGDHNSAASYYLEAITIDRQVYRKNQQISSNGWTLSDHLVQLGNLHLRNEFFDEALKLFVESYKICKRISCYDSNSAISFYKVYECEISIGDFYSKVGNYKKTEQYYKKANNTSRAFILGYPKNNLARRSTYICQTRLGTLLMNAGKYDDSINHYKQALNISSELSRSYPDDATALRDLFICYSELCRLSMKINNPETAKEYGENALRISESIYLKDPENMEKAKDYSMSLNNSGFISLSMNDVENALRHYSKALELGLNIFKKNTNSIEQARNLILFYSNLANVYQKKNELVKAEGALSHMRELKTRFNLAE